jgi:tryptophan synthase alpha subunit
VGFGVSNADQFQQVAQHADGVVIGSKFITTIQEAGTCIFLIISLIER